MRAWESNKSIRHTALTLALAFLATLLIGFGIDRRETGKLMDRTRDDLLLVMALRTSALEQYLETVRAQAVLWSDFGRLREGFAALSGAWTELGGDASSTLRRLYIEENPYPVGQKHRYDSAGDGSTYSVLHATIQPRARRFLEIHGYYDVFLFNPQGDLIYTAFKEDDFGTNLVKGSWRDTGLGDVFRAARDASDRRFVAFTDFEAYEPSQGEPASFIASPVYAGDELLGVLAFQIPTDHVHEMMQFTAGMGETGETYIVGEDLLMRSNSRFSETPTILRTAVDSDVVRRALAGETGAELTTDYRGVPSLAAYGPLEFEGVRWAVVAEIDEAEVLEPAGRLRKTLLIVGIVVVTLVGAAGGAHFASLGRG